MRKIETWFWWNMQSIHSNIIVINKYEILLTRRVTTEQCATWPCISGLTLTKQLRIELTRVITDANFIVLASAINYYGHSALFKRFAAVNILKVSYPFVSTSLLEKANP